MIIASCEDVLLTNSERQRLECWVLVLVNLGVETVIVLVGALAAQQDVEEKGRSIKKHSSAVLRTN